MGNKADLGYRSTPIFRLALALLCVAMAAAFGIVVSACVSQTGGKFIYALDDPYIHMGIARNFAEHFVWGVTRYANASASSSPLWTVLLASCIRLVGDRVLLPLVLGMIFSAWTGVLLLDRFVRIGINAWVSALAAALVFFSGPLHILPVSGMEHSLQILLDLMFLFWLGDVLSRDLARRDYVVGVALPMLMCLDRYESVFVVVVPFFACLLSRRWKLAACIAAGPILGIGGFALFSHFMGMPLIPNSIIIKGNLPKTGAADFLSSIVVRLRALFNAATPALSDLLVFAIAAGVVLELKPMRRQCRTERMFIWSAVFATLVHASLASFGWFFRYEAYLVVMLAAALVLAWWKMFLYRGSAEDRILSKGAWLAITVALCVAQFGIARFTMYLNMRFNIYLTVVIFGFASLAALDRGTNSLGRYIRTALIYLVPISYFFMIQERPLNAFDSAPKACTDIYLQQTQMARFLGRYYPSSRVAVNDIGAVTYFTDVHLLDLYGLASDDIAKLKLKRRYRTDTISDAVKKFQPDVTIVYPNWFSGATSMPSWMIQVASWTIPPVTSAGGATVMFYACSPQEAKQIQANLRQFQPSLPQAVKVAYMPVPTHA